MIECQVNYIIKLLRIAKQNKAWKYVQVTQEAVDSFYDTHIRKALIGKVKIIISAETNHIYFLHLSVV